MENATSVRPYLTRLEAAEYLTERGFKTAKLTLQKLASTGGGPPYRIFGKRALYSPDDLIAWAESRCSELKVSA